MATEKLKRLAAQYVDLRISGQAHAQLTAWGRRLGMSPEGMARMILLMRMHEMMPIIDDDANFQSSDTHQQQSQACWESRLRSIGITSDALPPPRKVIDDLRFYHADDFTWPEGSVPTQVMASIDSQGRIQSLAMPPSFEHDDGASPH